MGKDTGSLFVLIGLLAGAALLAWIGALVVARIVRRRLGGASGEQPFTLQDLRELRAQGMITEAEFQTMRAGILGRYAALETPQPEQSNPAGDPLDDLFPPDDLRDEKPDEDDRPD